MDDLELQLAVRIGKAVRTCRAKLGWAQADLAERVDSSVEYVSLLERGERLPSVGMLVRLARVLGVSGSTILGEESFAPNKADDLQALTRAVPEEARPAVAGMLRGVIATYRKKPKKRARR